MTFHYLRNPDTLFMETNKRRRRPPSLVDNKEVHNLGEIMPSDADKSLHTNANEDNRISENHRICIQDIDTGEKFTFSLVPSDEMDTKNGEISVKTSLGCALIGHTPGSLIEWRAPSRLRKFVVKSISPIGEKMQQQSE